MEATSLLLPYCFPGFVFIGQSETPDSQKFFCTCTRRAIDNYISNLLREKEHRQATTGLKPAGIYDFVLDHAFPAELSKEMFDRGISNKGAFEALVFRHAICHKCNLAVPPHESVESPSYFHSIFGRLIYRDLYDIGFDFVGNPLRFVRTQEQEQLLPVDFAARIQERDRLRSAIESTKTGSFYTTDWRTVGRLNRALRNEENYIGDCRASVLKFVEEKLRQYYGFPARKSWLQQETVLYLMIRQLFRDHEILRHAKPDFLQGLELDIWIPKIRTAVEFQGAQHSQEFEYLGGEAALAATKERDSRKAHLCKHQGIKLIYFHEGEQITEESVKARLITPFEGGMPVR